MKLKPVRRKQKNVFQIRMIVGWQIFNNLRLIMGAKFPS